MCEPILPNPLEPRLRRLETTNRRLLTALAIGSGLILLGASRVGRQGVSTVVRTQAVEVVDAAGKVQARLAATAAGPELHFLDGEGVVRATLEHGPDGTALYFMDTVGTTRVGVAQFAHGGGGVALHGEKSKGAAVLYLKDAAGSLTFYGTDGAVEGRLPSR